MSQPKRVAIITLGCVKNTNDTENLAGLLQKNGVAVEKDPSRADAIVVHTCSFINAAKKESIHTILEAAKLKGGGKKLIVTGCMVQQHGKELLAELPEVDAFLGTGQLAQIPTLLKNPFTRFLDRSKPGGLTDPDAERALEKGVSASLRLSEGCGHPCSFCVIPKLRGGLKSRSEENILTEAKLLAAKGIQEISLIGQDTGDWGRDIYKERRLPTLMRKLRDIPGFRWIRLMYLHPFSCTPELLDVLAESPEIFPYLDMPLQHIDNTLLLDMKRKQGETELRRLMERVRERLPDISLRTTFIVGYPGETEKRFTKLNAFVNEGYFDYLGAFAYSREDSTPAAAKKNQVPEKIARERQEALMATHFNVAHMKAMKRIGATETILLEDREGDTILGRTRREAPEIDAVVRLARKGTRGKQFVQAQLTEYDAYEFQGKLVV